MRVNSEQEMLDFGAEVASRLKATNSAGAKVIELVGDVGVGKTTFTRGLVKALGVETEVTSPSFTISKSYATRDGKMLTHYDFYRLGDVGLMEDDFREKLADPEQIIVVEWGEAMKDFLPEDHLRLEIKLNDDESRDIIEA